MMPPAYSIANGMTACIYPRLMPTPALSFAVRHLSCDAGICITASHNPAEYNGYKVYGSDGCQITTAAADEIGREIQNSEPLMQITKPFSYSSPGITMISDNTVDAYISAVMDQRVARDEHTNLRIVYTPLNGAGLECVTRTLEMAGYHDIHLVEEQRKPDSQFTTCHTPNPEEPAALDLGLQLAQAVHADLLLATDPDCDRVGVAAAEDGGFTILSGNEVGVLLLDYLCQMRITGGNMPCHPVAVKTIVTTDMAKPVAAKYGVQLFEVLTGFKYIGEQIGLLEQNGEAGRFIFGFEESCGYLSGIHVRDKDAVNACCLIADMAQHYKRQGLTLAQRMQGLYLEHGFFANTLFSLQLDGENGLWQIRSIMQSLRATPPEHIGGTAVTNTVDYLYPEQRVAGPRLPSSDVLRFALEDNSTVTVRPSGTEPKLKVYLSVKGANASAAEGALAMLAKAMKALLEGRMDCEIN